MFDHIRMHQVSKVNERVYNIYSTGKDSENGFCQLATQYMHSTVHDTHTT